MGMKIQGQKLVIARIMHMYASLNLFSCCFAETYGSFLLLFCSHIFLSGDICRMNFRDGSAHSSHCSLV